MISDPKIQPPPQARFATRPRATPVATPRRASGTRAGPPNLGEACRLAGEPRPPRLRRDTLAGHCARRPAGRGRWPTAARTAQQCFPLMLCHNRVSPSGRTFLKKNQISRTKAARPPGNGKSPSWFCRLPAVPGQARARLAWRGAANYEAPLQGRPNA